MAIEFPSYETDDPRRILSAFVIQTRDFLAELVKNNRDSRGRLPFHRELLSETRAA